jgi:hypothetical protein
MPFQADVVWQASFFDPFYASCRKTADKPVRDPLENCHKGLSSCSPQGAFPHCEYAPVIIRELGLRNLVPSHVLKNFCTPKKRAGCRHSEHRTEVAVPETAMHKDDSTEARKNQIRTTGKVFPVDSKPKSASVERTAHHKFGSCVTAANAAHIEPPLFGGENVGHPD